MKTIQALLLATASFAALSASAGFAFAQDGVGDITVTARRVQERLQDTPLSVTVATEEMLASAQIGSNPRPELVEG